MPTVYLTHPACLKHDLGGDHPETPARLHAIEDQLIASGLMQLLDYQQARSVTREELLLVHSVEHVDGMYAMASVQQQTRTLVQLDDDTALGPHTLEAACFAAGAVVQAVDMVMAGEALNAFCNVRPPGHHANRHQAAGFCIFNNLAVGVARALHHHGLRRVAVVDFDVHHGDGTEAIFHDEPRVLMCSTFRHPFYPYSGTGPHSPHRINVPLPAGADGDRFRAAVTEFWLPALQAFAPEMIFISAGFDAHREDEMGGLALREADYAWVTRLLMQQAEATAAGRIVSVLEGGYALSALGRSACAHIRALSAE
ncbi:histone deacetylase family protein [Pseudomethylobacillus aquaticus]|uniref:Histone deacetylase family protein n=1 Tax=Pseudomethylobacillus aquaticus TaxID=2676064 RepID=A0A3N0V389_9PROT|nr:histone deacetylase family protein [Pseudomethylobacillus aquaticus]ROH87193.1 histone deacetylase family protein [Pseudomethylobacillus aquaticus]